jgi:hypothetical protein
MTGGIVTIGEVFSSISDELTKKHIAQKQILVYSIVMEDCPSALEVIRRSDI